MYRILLAEDEKWIRSNLIRQINELSDYQVCWEASTGLEALAQLQKAEPDVVVTDIRMPGLDGLEMIKQAREKYPDLPFLVFSGYQDFELVKGAFKLGSVDYLMKPVRIEEMAEALRRAVRNRKQSAAQAAYLPQIDLEPLFLRALEGDEEDISRFAVNAVKKLPAMGPDQSKVLLVFDDLVSREALFEVITNHTKGTVYCTQSQVFAAVANIHPKWTESDLRVWTGRLADELFAKHKAEIAVGFSSKFQGWNQVPSKFREAFAGYALRFYEKKRWVGGPSQAARSGSSLSDAQEQALEEYMSRIEAAFQSGALDEMQWRLQSLFSACTGERVFMTEVHRLSARLLRRIIGPFSEDERELLGLGTWNAAQWVQKRRTAEELRIDMAALLVQARSRLNHYSGNIQSIIGQAQAIIDREYADPELTVGRLAEQIHISPSYFSTLFKKKTGLHFSQYLSDTRLEKSRELLRDKRLKTYEVAASVGYSNDKAFSRAFSRKFGMSPQMFRRQCGLL